MNSLNEARIFVEQGKRTNDGVICPCCDRFAKLYDRYATAAMTYALILIYKKNKTNWLHVTKFLTKEGISAGRDVVTFCHWHLMEKKEGGKKDGNPSRGVFRITENGVLFIYDKITIPKYCFLYNDKVDHFSAEQITIQEALTEKFSYSDLIPQSLIRQVSPSLQLQLFKSAA